MARAGEFQQFFENSIQIITYYIYNKIRRFCKSVDRSITWKAQAHAPQRFGSGAAAAKEAVRRIGAA